MKNIFHVFNPGFNNGGSIRVPYDDGSGQIAYAEFTSADAPGAFTPNTGISDNVPAVSGNNAIVCSALDGTDQHLLYSGGGVGGLDRDLFHDKNKTADVEELDGVTVNRISCNVYDRSGAKLAYVYDDGGTIKYNEVNLVVAVNNSLATLWEAEGRVNRTSVPPWEAESRAVNVSGALWENEQGIFVQNGPLLENEQGVLKAQGILWENEALALPPPVVLAGPMRIHLGNFSGHRPPF